MRRPRSATVAITATVTLAAGLLAPAAASAAGWTSPTAVQPGINPVLTFSPTGAAAIGSDTVSVRGKLTGSDIDLATDGVSFATSPYTLAAPSRGQMLASLALSSAGYLAAAFANPTTAAPVLGRVAKPAPSQFSSAQQLIPTGTAQGAQSDPDVLDMVATSAGEIVGAGMDDSGQLYTASLAAHETSFRVARGPRALSATDDFGLATGPAGDTFLAGDGADGCTTVAFRPARGRFTQTYATGNCSSATPNVFDAIATGASGQAALLSEDVSESGSGASRLLVQTGRDGRFGAATQLGGVLGNANIGLASDADGQLVAEWTGCQAGPVVAGELSTTDCAIDAAAGSLRRGFSPAAAAGSTLVTATSGTLTALTADRAVAVSACQAGRCEFTVFTATSAGRFRAAHTLASGKRLIALTGDDHGDLLAVWASSQGQLYAATGSAASGSWSAPHRLSSRAITPSEVIARYGPHGKAIVAWSVRNMIYAAGFSR